MDPVEGSAPQPTAQDRVLLWRQSAPPERALCCRRVSVKAARPPLTVDNGGRIKVLDHSRRLTNHCCVDSIRRKECTARARRSEKHLRWCISEVPPCAPFFVGIWRIVAIRARAHLYSSLTAQAGSLSAHLPIVVEHINCWFLLDFCGPYWQFGLHPKFARG